MSRGFSIGLVLSALLAIGQMGLYPAGAFAQDIKAIQVISELTVTDFTYPESVACDSRAKVLYVSEFGSELKPTLKDGKGKISKVSLNGKVLEERFLPAAGETLNKPKGIWVQGDRLWVTDIDVVWVFDLKTRKGRQVDLPGVKFANDPTVIGNALYVSDNRGDQLYRVEPADFLNISGDPKVTLIFSGLSIHPNGVYPAQDGSLLMVGFKSKDDGRGIYALDARGGKLSALSKDLGRLDGVAQLDDGSLLVTDWNSGSLFRWSVQRGMETLASGFKGPADFCVAADTDWLLVVVPDLVKSELRLVRLAK